MIPGAPLDTGLYRVAKHEFGGGQSGTSISKTDSQPWDKQQGYLEYGYNQAGMNYSRPKSYYPGSTVVPLSGQTEQALQGMENTATQGNGVNQAALGNIQQTLNGDFLDPTQNPAFQKAAMGIGSQVGGAFSGAGRYGSGAMANQGREALTDLAAKTYGAERQNQMQALGLAPQISPLAYADNQMLAQVGGVREAQAGSQIQDQLARWNFAQNEPQQRLAQYMATVAGGSPGGQTTTSQPIYSNPWATGVGLASSAAGIASNLFGKGGLFG
jgi:hypothetical protein